MKKHSKLIWSLITLGLAVLTISVILLASKELTFNDLVIAVRDAHKGWLFLAILCMLGIIVFEGEGLRCLLKSSGYPCSHRKGIKYAAADIYFSAITPSASGGQPMSAFFMVTDGAPGGIVAGLLLINLIMYMIAIVAIGLYCFIMYPAVFLNFSIPGRILIIFGYLVMIGFVVFFLFLMTNAPRIFRWGCAIIRWLYKKKFIKQPDYWKNRMETVINDYQNCVTIARGKPLMLLTVFLFNLLHRLSQLSVSMFMYLATGGELSKAGSVWLTQIYVIMGSNFIPIPGSMGITDYLMIDGFQSLMETHQAVQLELLSRSVSFYCCTLLSALITLAAFMIFRSRRAKKRAQQRAQAVQE